MYKNSFRRDWNHLQGLPQEKRAKGTTAEFFLLEIKRGQSISLAKRLIFNFQMENVFLVCE